MKCFNPIQAKKEPIIENGRIIDYSIIFTSDERQGISSFYVPCGVCMGCRLQKAQDWSVRMMHEKQMHEESSFITLTYNDQNLPVNGSLKYDDVTAFIKRLRKITGKKLSYYYAGEYGEQLGRPHYHMILFGSEFREKITYKKKLNKVEHLYTNDNGHKVYKSSLLDDLWSLGHADFGEVTYDSCMYVAKYTTKKIIGDLKEQHYKKPNIITGEITEVETEQARMSRKPAIGKTWLEKYHHDTFRDDYIIINNKKLSIPPYYMKWLEKNNIDKYLELKQKRENNLKELDHIELNRQYEVQLIKHEKYVSSTGEKSKVNLIDDVSMNYKKRKIEDFHNYEKKLLHENHQ